MINSFKKAVKPLVAGVLALGMAATPALAGDKGGLPRINMTKYNSGAAEKWVQEKCPDSKGALGCENKIVLVTYSNVGKNDAFAKAGFVAADRLHKEGVPVVYVMASDNDDNEQTATMMPYVNGTRYDGIKLSTKYGIIAERNVRFASMEDEIYQAGKDLHDRVGLAKVDQPVEIPSIALLNQ